LRELDHTYCFVGISRHGNMEKTITLECMTSEVGVIY